MSRRRRPPSAVEREVLDVVLVELRRAMRLRTQLTILLDPFTLGDGIYVFASPQEDGVTYTIGSSSLRRSPKKKPGGRS